MGSLADHCAKDVPGAYEVIRGGDVIAYLGFVVALRPWVRKTRRFVEKFLAATSEADQWMRKNPKQAAAIATRWISGLKLDVAETAMQFNVQQLDRRLSANNYRALWNAEERLSRLGILKSTFDVNKHIEPKPILNVMKARPELFADLPRFRTMSRSARALYLSHKCDKAARIWLRGFYERRGSYGEGLLDRTRRCT